MRTFIVLMLVGMIGPRAAVAQPRETGNPCVEHRNQTPQLRPVDEAPSRPEFLQYRARLQAAVERRDLDALIESADPGIRLGFDASGGAAAMRKVFGERSESWDELRSALALGGTFTSPASFAAPYVYSRWPDRLDSFECAAITGRNVRFRSAPRLDAPIMTALSYSIVQRLNATADGEQWVNARLGDGRTGYVWHAYVRSPVDYRALFNLIGGRWQMTAFVAGD